MRFISRYALRFGGVFLVALLVINLIPFFIGIDVSNRGGTVILALVVAVFIEAAGLVKRG